MENFLTELSGFGSSPTRLSYHDNGALSRVEHSTGSVDEIGLDPHRMGRPSYLRSLRPNQQEMFSSATYLYDGSGNTRSIGEDSYVCDAASRLVGAEVGFEGSTTFQAFHYDGADNLLRIDTGANQQALFPDPLTSQIAGNTYDTAGNLTQGGGLGSFSYDSLGMVNQATGSSKKQQYVLTPEEERLLVLDDSDRPQPGPESPTPLPQQPHLDHRLGVLELGAGLRLPGEVQRSVAVNRSQSLRNHSPAQRQRGKPNEPD